MKAGNDNHNTTAKSPPGRKRQRHPNLKSNHSHRHRHTTGPQAACWKGKKEVGMTCYHVIIPRAFRKFLRLNHACTTTPGHARKRTGCKRSHWCHRTKCRGTFQPAVRAVTGATRQNTGAHSYENRLHRGSLVPQDKDTANKFNNLNRATSSHI